MGWDGASLNGLVEDVREDGSNFGCFFFEDDGVDVVGSSGFKWINREEFGAYLIFCDSDSFSSVRLVREGRGGGSWLDSLVNTFEY
jgi:hypothetical protein